MRFVSLLGLGLLVGLALVAIPGAPSDAGDFQQLHVIRQIPQDETSLIAAHTAAAERSCVEVPEDQPLEKNTPAAINQDDVWNTAGRVGLLALGMDMTAADRDRLPRLTRGMILEKVDNSYLSIQAGIARDEQGTHYLLDRPLAAVAGYGDSNESQEFAALAQSSVRDLRSLGLFVAPGEAVQPRNLRTLVLAHKSTHARETPEGTTQLVPGYELMFVRARDEAGQLVIHGFATSGERSRLHYFGKYQTPETVRHCDICSTICFTNFGGLGLKPTARATRNVEFRAASTFPIEKLNAYVAERGLAGTALDNLSIVLDAVIDGQIR